MEHEGSFPHSEQATRIPPSSGLLCSVSWFKTDVLGLPKGSIFKDQVVHEEDWRTKVLYYRRSTCYPLIPLPPSHSTLFGHFTILSDPLFPLFLAPLI
jgi:hypothetical protein